MPYKITEPHPSIPSSHLIHSGRGGAGNVTRVDPSTVTSGPSATGPASRVKLTPPPANAIFMSGRGGAGNMHREKERAMFSFDEELAQQERIREHAAPVYHIGRGGAGNAVDEMKRQDSTSSTDTAASGTENGGVRQSLEGAWHRVSKQFSRGQ